MREGYKKKIWKKSLHPCQWRKESDPDPHLKVTDPQHFLWCSFSFRAWRTFCTPGLTRRAAGPRENSSPRKQRIPDDLQWNLWTFCLVFFLWLEWRVVPYGLSLAAHETSSRRSRSRRSFSSPFLISAYFSMGLDWVLGWVGTGRTGVFWCLIWSGPVFRIRIRIHRIHMFLGLPDPSIIKQK